MSVLITGLLIIAAAVAGAPIAGFVIVSIASRCEDSKWSLGGPPPGLIQAAARRILNFHSDDRADGSLLGREVLEHQGVLGRDKVAERHLIKRKLPEEREHPVVVDLRSARQADLFDFPAARLSQSVADLPNKSLLRLELKARRNGKGTYRAHRHILDPTVLTHRVVRPFSD